MLGPIRQILTAPVKTAPLAVFRILFGILMLISLIRFWYHGWIEKLYINPPFHFHYEFFDWVVVPGEWTYILFVVSGIAAVGVALGYQYRFSIITFFLSFTYIELMDKTTYLNHYYFISVLSFIMIWLPMHRYFSVDVYRSPKIEASHVPRWSILSLQVLLAIVYVYAGAAKLNYDWMVRAMPLTIWLPTKFDIPLIGTLLHEKWMHYAFSWGGALYDLTIPFLLWYSRTRVLAFILVVVFHVLTRVLFPIGMFPYIMIMATMIFFDDRVHERILKWLAQLLRLQLPYAIKGRVAGIQKSLLERSAPYVIGGVLLFQLLFPLRFMLYPGNVFWTEQGYRFSWRVMLMEKTGYANFKIVDGKSGKRFYVQNEDFLTSFQQKQMSMQSDFIIEYGQYLGNHFKSQGHENVEVYVESYASLNGRPNQPYFKSDIDIMTISNESTYRDYISPLDD